MRIRIALAHHVEDRPVAGDQQPLLAISREQHVVGRQRERLADADRLLTGAFHVERDLALALLPEHPVVIGAGQHHRAQAAAQCLGRELRVPGTDGRSFVVENADQLIGERVRLLRRHRDVGTLDGAGGKPRHIAVIRRLVGV